MSKKYENCVACGGFKERREIVCPNCGHVNWIRLLTLAVIGVLLIAGAAAIARWLPSSFTWILVQIALYSTAGFTLLACVVHLLKAVKHRIGAWLYLIIAVLLALGVGIQIGLRFLADRSTYEQAHANYMKVDCAAALPLYDQGYTSIGCQPCTSLPADPANLRSGRWGGAKLECGMHTFPTPRSAR